MHYSALLLFTPGIYTHRCLMCRAYAAPASVQGQDGKTPPGDEPLVAGPYVHLCGRDMTVKLAPVRII